MEGECITYTQSKRQMSREREQQMKKGSICYSITYPHHSVGCGEGSFKASVALSGFD